VGTGDCFPGGVKRQRRDADHSPPSNSEVKKNEATLLLPYSSSWRDV
jgi:hypothetical protein